MATNYEPTEGSATYRRLRHEDATELNHRIANSLQLVSIFLSWQERDIADAAAKRVLKAASKRVAAIGKVQRALLLGNSHTVDLNAFLGALCSEIEVLTGLVISVQADDVAVEAKQAQHIGIAINELLINAAKHGYGERGGEVTVTCKRSPGGFLLVTVSDQGRGLPDDFAPEGDSSIGMTILRSTARQLEGELTFRSGRGATAKLKFPMR